VKIEAMPTQTILMLRSGFRGTEAVGIIVFTRNRRRILRHHIFSTGIAHTQGRRRQFLVRLHWLYESLRTGLGGSGISYPDRTNSSGGESYPGLPNSSMRCATPPCCNASAMCATSRDLRLSFLLELQRQTPQIAMRVTAARLPTTIPAMAPSDKAGLGVPVMMVAAAEGAAVPVGVTKDEDMGYQFGT
jgi:hypothetical protein